MNQMTKKFLIALLAVSAFATVSCGKKSKSNRPTPHSAQTAQPDGFREGVVQNPNDGSYDNSASNDPNNDADYFDRDDYSNQNRDTSRDTLIGDRNQPDVIVPGQTSENGNEDSVVLSPRDPYEREDGSKYPTIEKDVLYDDNTQLQYQGDRSGEFGAVLADDPMWFPGLPDYPAGHPQSKLNRIFTGGISSLGAPNNSFKFTDGKSDNQMAILVARFDQTAPGQKKNVTFHKDIKEESRKLAQRISDVRLKVDKYSTGRAEIEIEFADGDVNKPVRIFLHGMLDASRSASLKQVDIKGDKDLHFTGELHCRDTDGGCQNAVIRIIQYKKEEVCRIAYIVHRSGDAHITMSEQDRIRYEIQNNPDHRFMAEYLSNSAYNACQVNKKRDDIPSRLKNHFLAYCGDGNYKKLPSAKSIGFKTWAAAYGASQFRIILKDEDHWTGLAAGPETVIYGPLVYADNNSPMYNKKLKLSGTHAPFIKSAHLVNNDGGGNLNILLRFAGPDESEMQISVTSMIRNTGAVEIAEEPRG